jgi:Cys-tRNA(Pro)/Cys-tRNA(Cys) deacylase
MTPAVVALRAAGVAFSLHEYAHDPRAQEKGQSFGLEAAEQLGLDPDRVYKTLMASADGELVVAVVPVSGRLDLKALARAAGASKALMAEVTAAERATGYVAGGISPFGQRRRHRTVVDETVELWDTVFVSGGRRGLDLEIAPADLIEVTGAILADIGR